MNVRIHTLVIRTQFAPTHQAASAADVYSATRATAPSAKVTISSLHLSTLLSLDATCVCSRGRYSTELIVLLGLLPAIRSLERKARYLFYFCCFVRFLSTISRQPAGQFTPNFACRRTLVPNVSSPLLGVGGPRQAEKGKI